jgi:DUF1365 family protein
MECLESKNQICIGTIFHKRYEPKFHTFKYKTFFIKISLKKTEEIKSFFFSLNKFNLISFYHLDHGFRDGTDLFTFAKSILKNFEIDEEIDDIILQTFPRIMGYVFNPVSFWYLKNQHQNLIGIIVEVNNTFGGTHSYFIKDLNDLEHSKIFHVSPFNKIIGNYRFSFFKKDNYEKVTINYFIKDHLTLSASIDGNHFNWNNSLLLKLVITNPLVNFLAFYRIHLHALFLYIKGVPFYGKNGAIK